MVETEGATLHVEDSKEVEADPDRLQRLFENLISNAVDHNDDPVTCTVGTFDSGLYFEDTGEGIPAADYDNVFESGFTTATDHTGFGLAIVRRIATAHGWEVSAGESEAGGVRFELSGVELGPAVFD